MMCHADEDEALARGLEGGNFFGYSLGHYYVFGEHQPGSTDVWEEFLERRGDHGYSPEVEAALRQERLGRQAGGGGPHRPARRHRHAGSGARVPRALRGGRRGPGHLRAAGGQEPPRAHLRVPRALRARGAPGVQGARRGSGQGEGRPPGPRARRRPGPQGRTTAAARLAAGLLLPGHAARAGPRRRAAWSCASGSSSSPSRGPRACRTTGWAFSATDRQSAAPGGQRCRRSRSSWPTESGRALPARPATPGRNPSSTSSRKRNDGRAAAVSHTSAMAAHGEQPDHNVAHGQIRPYRARPLAAVQDLLQQRGQQVEAGAGGAPGRGLGGGPPATGRGHAATHELEDGLAVGHLVEHRLGDLAVAPLRPRRPPPRTARPCGGSAGRACPHRRRPARRSSPWRRRSPARRRPAGRRRGCGPG